MNTTKTKSDALTPIEDVRILMSVVAFPATSKCDSFWTLEIHSVCEVYEGQWATWEQGRLRTPAPKQEVLAHAERLARTLREKHKDRGNVSVELVVKELVTA
jgi:hypothetical protein